MTPAQRKFLKIVKDEHYFDKDSKILLALSGGKDSMTLFNWLYDLKEVLGIELDWLTLIMAYEKSQSLKKLLFEKWQQNLKYQFMLTSLQESLQKKMHVISVISFLKS